MTKAALALALLGSLGASAQNVVHGWLMTLPLCEEGALKHFPKGARVADKPEPGIEGEEDGTADFGGGAKLAHLKKKAMSCRKLGDTFVAPDADYFYSFRQMDFPADKEAELLVMSGFVSNVKNAKVRGQVSLANRFVGVYSSDPRVSRNYAIPKGITGIRGNKDLFAEMAEKSKPAEDKKRAELGRGAVVLRLSVEKEEGKWTTLKEVTDIFFFEGVATKIKTMIVEADVPANSKIKLAVVARWGKLVENVEKQTATNALLLHDARLFGAQCYPDFAKPEKCLGDK